MIQQLGFVRVKHICVADIVQQCRANDPSYALDLLGPYGYFAAPRFHGHIANRSYDVFFLPTLIGFNLLDSCDA
jgi:hypothetical protein